MKTRKREYKRFLLIGLLALLVFPLINKSLNGIEVDPLKGAQKEALDTGFTSEGWIGGLFQPKREEFLGSTFSLRPSVIRMNNQLRFWLYKEAKIRNVVVGKENYLYESGYISGYQGETYIGDDLIKSRAYKLNYLQDTLAKLGKQLIVLLEPGKASFYPEYIPDDFKKPLKKSNYSAFLGYAKELGLEVTDFNKWFVQLKKTEKYPLYTKFGIHWTEYGATLAADSLMRYLEVKRNQDLHNIRFDQVVLTTECRGTDCDIETAMNLVYPLKLDKRNAYPIRKLTGENLYRPNMLAIADSYFWTLFNMQEFQKSMSDNSQFWYYNKEVNYFNWHGQEIHDVRMMNWKETVLSSDVVLVGVTECNDWVTSWGFIDDMYDILNGVYGQRITPELRGMKIDWYLNKMRNQPEWLQALQEKAKGMNQPLDSVMRWDAGYLVDQEFNIK